MYGVELHDVALATDCVAQATRCLPGDLADHCSFSAGDGTMGWPANAEQRFDAIHVGAAVEEKVPRSLLDSLAPDGLMVIPVSGTLLKIHRKPTGDVACDVVPGGDSQFQASVVYGNVGFTKIQQLGD